MAGNHSRQFLFRNEGDGTFTEVSMVAGVAFQDDGEEFSGRGSVFADLGNDGFLDIVTTTLSEEQSATRFYLILPRNTLWI